MGYGIPLLLIELTSYSIFIKEIPLNFDIDSIYKEFPWEFFFTWKSFVKIFRLFKLESDFFSTFFLQNQKTRKLRTFNLFELHLSQFSAKSGTKNFFTFTSLSLSLSLTIIPIKKLFHQNSKIAHIYILKYKCANFQQNRRQKDSPSVTQSVT